MVMFKFLEHKKNGTWVNNVLVIVIRLAITGFIVTLGFYLAFASTMGPPIAPIILPENWTKKLQQIR